MLRRGTQRIGLARARSEQLLRSTRRTLKVASGRDYDLCVIGGGPGE